MANLIWGVIKSFSMAKKAHDVNMMLLIISYCNPAIYKQRE